MIDLNEIDYESYQKLFFYDEKYTQENNINNKTKFSFFTCLKEEGNFYTPVSYEKMGISLLISILDYEQINPFSRVGNSNYKTVENLRNITANIIYNSDDKYKGSFMCQNYMKNIHSVKKFISLNEKFSIKISQKENVIIKKSQSTSNKQFLSKGNNDNINNLFELSSKLTSSSRTNGNNNNFNKENLCNLKFKFLYRFKNSE